MIIASVNLPASNTGVGQAPTRILITDATTQIVASNVKRTALYLLNVGQYDVWVSCDESAEVEKGMLLGKMGGSVLIDTTNLTTGSVNGICEGTKFSNITSQELLRS